MWTLDSKQSDAFIILNINNNIRYKIYRRGISYGMLLIVNKKVKVWMTLSLTTYLLNLETNFFSKLSAFLYMGTNCTPLLVDIFNFSYKSEFLHTIVKNQKFKNSDHLMSHSDILRMFFPLTVQTFLIGFYRYILQN